MREVTEPHGRRASLAAIWSAAGLIVASLAMMAIQSTYPPRVLPAGTTPGLAMELPHSAADIANVLGAPGSADSEKAATIMQQLQYWDEFLYIPAYVVFFIAAGWFLFLYKAGWWRWLGCAAIALVLVCAVFDYLEDLGILRAINSYREHTLSQSDADGILPWGLWKWGTLYAVLLCLSPLPIDRWHSQLLRITGLFIGLLAALSGVSGIVGALFQNAVRVSSSVPGILGLVLFFFPLYALARKGLVAGLDALAGVGAVHWLSRWTKYGKHPIELPDLTRYAPRNRLGQIRQEMASKLSENLISEPTASETCELPARHIPPEALEP